MAAENTLSAVFGLAFTAWILWRLCKYGPPWKWNWFWLCTPPVGSVQQQQSYVQAANPVVPVLQQQQLSYVPIAQPVAPVPQHQLDVPMAQPVAQDMFNPVNIHDWKFYDNPLDAFFIHIKSGYRVNFGTQEFEVLRKAYNEANPYNKFVLEYAGGNQLRL